MKLAAESIRDLIVSARRGQDGVLGAINELTAAEFGEPSLLPGWKRAHVVAHLVGNARGQHRMLATAQRGELAVQYPGGASGRAAEIDVLAALPATELRSQLVDACEALVEIWTSMPEDAWMRPTNALMGVRPAWASVWARWRESEIHHVDLHLGYGPNDWPTDFVELLAQRLFGADGIAALERRLPEGAAVMACLSRGSVHVGPRACIPTILTGTDHELAAWALGRPCGGLTSMIDERRTSPPRLAPFA